MIAIKLEDFFENINLDKLAEMYEQITEAILTVKDTGINYRVINHWDDKNIIRFSRRSTEGNRKFSLVDFIWIKCVEELRKFGVKLPEIKKIANDIYELIPMMELMEAVANNIELFQHYEGEKKEDFINFFKSGEYKNADMPELDFNYLQILIAEAIRTRLPISLVLFKNGDWFPYFAHKEKSYPEELLYRKEFSSFISIGLTDIVFKYLAEEKLQDSFQSLNIFTLKEAKLINILQKGNYKKITVVSNKKNHKPIEFLNDKNTIEHILKIIRLKQYKEFVLIDNKNNEVIIGKK